MCEICRQETCPCECPSYNLEGRNAGKGRRINTCELCGCDIYEGEDVVVSDGIAYCSECVKNLDIDDVLRICEIASVRKLLDCFGY